MSELADEALEAVREIEPLLKGRHPAVQGAILAQLLAKHLAGYQGGGEHIHEFREGVLQGHMDSVRSMVRALEAKP